ncbi:hypothetical protein P9421_23705 [Escherichia coli]|uniref:hypothetical protein n=1 Tax=Escherichia coli TaxID=562 RepID=UPI00389199E7
MTKLSYKCLETVFGDIPAHTFTMKVKELIPMYYVAVRGKDNEEGAVQRVLNSRRILKNIYLMVIYSLVLLFLTGLMIARKLKLMTV